MTWTPYLQADIALGGQLQCNDLYPAIVYLNSKNLRMSHTRPPGTAGSQGHPHHHKLHPRGATRRHGRAQPAGLSGSEEQLVDLFQGRQRARSERKARMKQENEMIPERPRILPTESSSVLLQYGKLPRSTHLAVWRAFISSQTSRVMACSPDRYAKPAARRSISALSVSSHGASMSSRPKCPYAAVAL
jgi:hypothetical protein